MSRIVLSGIHVYPVKSLAGISLERCELEPMGLRSDRRWMVVDRNGNFLSQRTHPQMALVQPRFEDNHLVFATFGMDDHAVPLHPSGGERLEVKIWNDTVNAVLVGGDADRWLSQAIGEECRLVRIPDDEIRSCDPRYAAPGDRTAFADGFPLLLISEASLEDLNRRLEHPVEIRRFRPNLVVSGCEPYAEDGWKRIRIGEIEIRVVKPCSRCPIPTVDPDAGAFAGPEPLATLSTYRHDGNKVHFGQNVAHDGEGFLETGAEIEVLEHSSP